MQKDFWSNSRVAVLGAGSFGTVLAQVLSQNVKEVTLWVREEKLAREINSTRINSRYCPGLVLNSKIKVTHEREKVFENGLDAVIWVLPSKVYREATRDFAPFFKGDEIVFHATKGVEDGTLKRISEILTEELPVHRIGVISGPNLAGEIARGDPAATVVASHFNEVVHAGYELFMNPKMRVYGVQDIVGVEWAGTLKNILAIASGTLDALQLGWNARAMLISRGLAEMVRFGVAMGGKTETFLGLAGVGDLLATCSSSMSRNYQVGFALGKGESLDQILKNLGSTAEGVRTSQVIGAYAQARGIYMPITEAVNQLVKGEITVPELMKDLMEKPERAEY
jgi:glycerol-3-phosphate dehydrogenase (NAD(P)+)